MNLAKQVSHRSTSKGKAFIGICLMLVMINLDFSIANVALPRIASYFNARINDLQWVINVYTMGISMLILTSGRMSDIFGQKKLFLIGVLGFGLSSLLIGLSFNMNMLIISRGIQGIMVAMPLPLAYFIGFKLYPDRIGYVASTLSATAGISQAVAPTLAGVILHYVSWRWLFIMNFPISLISAGFFYLFYHEDLSVQTKERLSYLSTILFALSIFFILFATNEGGRFGWHMPIIWGGFLLGVVLLVVFVWLQTIQKDALLDLRLFKDHYFKTILVVRFAFALYFFGFLFLFVLYLQNIRGLSALHCGYMIVFMTSIMGLLSAFFSKVSDKVGFRRPVILGVGLLTLTCIAFACITVTTPLVWIALLLIPTGFANGLLMCTLIPAALQTIKEQRRGIAIATLQTQLTLAGSLVVALFGGLLSFFSKQLLQGLLHKHAIIFNERSTQLLQKIADGSASASLYQQLLSAHADKAISFAKQAFMYGYHINLWVGVVICLVSFIAALHLRPDYKSSDG